MDLQLTNDEKAFLERVRGYCNAGLTQQQMADSERIPLTTLRLRLFECGFRVQSNTRRRLVRTGTGEEFAEAIA